MRRIPSGPLILELTSSRGERWLPRVEREAIGRVLFRLLGDARAVHALRAVLGEIAPSLSVHRLADREVIAAVVARVEAGRLHVVRRIVEPLRAWDTGDREPVVAEAQRHLPRAPRDEPRTWVADFAIAEPRAWEAEHAIAEPRIWTATIEATAG